MLYVLAVAFGALLADELRAEDKVVPTRPRLPVASPDARVLEGPGYRIEKLPAAPSTAAATAGTRQTVAGRSLAQTVFCRAGEDLLLQDLKVIANGSGVVAQRGCRLRIVDSEIRSDGVALIVEAGADVDLRHAVLTGRTGSIEAAPTARVAALGASFAGPATLVGTDFIDRGGNLWGSAP
jgi:hypothetical protein